MYGYLMVCFVLMLHICHSVGYKTQSVIGCCINCIRFQQFDLVNISSTNTCECASKDNMDKVLDQSCILQELHFLRSNNSTSIRDRLYTVTKNGCFVTVKKQTTEGNSDSTRFPRTTNNLNTTTTQANHPESSVTDSTTTSQRTTKNLNTTTTQARHPESSVPDSTTISQRTTNNLNKTTTHSRHPESSVSDSTTTSQRTTMTVNTATQHAKSSKPQTPSPTEAPDDYDEYVDETPTWPEKKDVPCSYRKDCATLLTENPRLKSGSYTINPGDGGKSFKVSCDMKRFGGGWTVIQRRKDGSESFYRTHREYAQGFGSLKREFWLGIEAADDVEIQKLEFNVHRVIRTSYVNSNTSYQLCQVSEVNIGNDRLHRLVKEPSLAIFDMMDFKKNNRYQIYNPFYVDGKEANYKLTLDKSYGTAGDCFTGSSGWGFSTKDSDHDFNMFISCAQTYGGGWWYRNCEQHLLFYKFLGANINGKYREKNGGLSWRAWNNHQTKLKVTELKIRAKSFYRDCASIKAEDPRFPNGLYTINPGDGMKSFKVYCDMKTHGGGWTVIQRRINGKEKFDKNFKAYEHGFGHHRTEFWLGLAKMNRLTKYTDVTLRFDMTDHRGKSRYAVYDSFSLGTPDTWYILKLGKYSGNAGDSFGESNNQYFQTNDQKSTKSHVSCWSGFQGGWWYHNCGDSDINGVYGDRKGFGIRWKTWHGSKYSLKHTEMKIRRTTGGVDCDILRKNGFKSGIHSINPDWKGKFKVYCNMSMDGFGWMVMQRRIDGSENFVRKWDDYKKGFGDKAKEFWIGNEYLHRTTGNQKHMLRIDMEDYDGDRRYAVYKDFTVGSEADFYRLFVGSYCGNAGDNLRYHNKAKFCTIDRDNDLEPNGECSKLYNGGWWYKKCHEANPNGKYNTDSYGQGVNWKDFRGMTHGIKYIEMKIRRQ